jgi:hypothetical protein
MAGASDKAIEAKREQFAKATNAAILKKLTALESLIPSTVLVSWGLAPGSKLSAEVTPCMRGNFPWRRNTHMASLGSTFKQELQLYICSNRYIRSHPLFFPLSFF